MEVQSESSLILQNQTKTGFASPPPCVLQRFGGRCSARQTSAKHKGWGGQRAHAASEKLDTVGELLL